MIIDLARFLAEERKYWTELEEVLTLVEREPAVNFALDRVRRFHYLYERACADLVRVQTSAHEPAVSRYLESLVARAYSEIYETRSHSTPFSVRRWLGRTLPQAFRRRLSAFALAAALTLAGVLFGVTAIRFDPDSKAILLPFPHLTMDPKERVRIEEKGERDAAGGTKASFSAFLMTHNIKVAVFTLSLGITWGVGTAIIIFYNGVTLGAVAADYIGAGQAAFLSGWLLPHGVVEIPAALIAAQAGFVLAGALIGRRGGRRLGERLRSAAPDIVTLALGAALLLVWAGVIESFFSQYHWPVLPYEVKIAFGLLELFALVVYLFFVGRVTEPAS